MNKDLLHDWTLVRIDFDWQSARVTIELEDCSATKKTLVAQGVQELHVPRMNEWGPSISVNEISQTDASTSDAQCLHIEMQSGDVIRVVAKQIALPLT